VQSERKRGAVEANNAALPSEIPEWRRLNLVVDICLLINIPDNA
jgi:hypothetical protein